MRDIIDGFLRFQRDAYPARSQLFKSLATRQAPKALFIACSDSRVVPELLTQREPGELFVIRNAGNIVPGYGPQPGGVSASVEYAVAVLGVGDIVVCGHSDCGAMGAIASCACLDQLPAVAGWLHHAEAARAMNSAHEHALRGGAAGRPGAAQRDRPTGQPAHPPLRRPRPGAGSAEPARLGLRHRKRPHRRPRQRQPALRLLAEHPEVRAVGGEPGQAVA